MVLILRWEKKEEETYFILLIIENDSEIIELYYSYNQFIYLFTSKNIKFKDNSSYFECLCKSSQERNEKNLTKIQKKFYEICEKKNITNISSFLYFFNIYNLNEKKDYSLNFNEDFIKKYNFSGFENPFKNLSSDSVFDLGPIDYKTLNNDVVHFKSLIHIGIGSFSEVFLATTEKNIFKKKRFFQKKVCIKYFSKKKTSKNKNKSCNGPDLQLTFKHYLSEFSFLLNLSHKNIIKLYDIITPIKNDVLFDWGLILQYCNQGTLKKYLELERNKNFTERDIENIFRQIINGIHGMKNYIHRDLTLENILVHNDIIKIADFGMVGIILTEKMECQEKSASYPYQAPELINQNGENITFTKKSDIFSLGVIFYYIIYRKFPWKQDEYFKWCKNKNYNTIQFPDCNGKNLFGDLISRMIEKDMSKRIDCQELFDIFGLKENIDKYVPTSTIKKISNISSCSNYRSFDIDNLKRNESIESNEEKNISIIEIKISDFNIKNNVEQIIEKKFQIEIIKFYFLEFVFCTIDTNKDIYDLFKIDEYIYIKFKKVLKQKCLDILFKLLYSVDHGKIIYDNDENDEKNKIWRLYIKDNPKIRIKIIELISEWSIKYKKVLDQNKNEDKFLLIQNYANFNQEFIISFENFYCKIKDFIINKYLINYEEYIKLQDSKNKNEKILLYLFSDLISIPNINNFFKYEKNYNILDYINKDYFSNRISVDETNQKLFHSIVNYLIKEKINF